MKRGWHWRRRRMTFTAVWALLALLLIGCGKAELPHRGLLFGTGSGAPQLTEAPNTQAHETVRGEDTIMTDRESTEITAESVAPVRSPAEKLLAEMTLTEKVAQLFILTPEQMTGIPSITSYDGTRHKVQAGGVILFGGNIQNPEQCKSLIAALQEGADFPMFVAVDEEGGRVARVSGNEAMGCEAFGPMGSISGEEEARRVGQVLGRQIGALGFNLDFAPVADVNSNPSNPVIGTRAFGDDPNAVARMVCAAVAGFHDSGMLCTLKHFPGHGDTTTDSHFGYTEVNKTREALWQTEFVPFKAGCDAGADFVMVGHISLPKVSANDLPATINPEILSILREEIGFEGIIITDSMRMQALSDRFASDEAAVMALEAGVDIILMPKEPALAMAGVVRAVEEGRLSPERIDESVLRVLQAKLDAGIVTA